MEGLFEAVREAASRQNWSSGVQLARGDAVQGERREAGELILRVAQRQGMLSQRVVLAPDDEDWSCDCGGADDPCPHVAAAVIALRRAEQAGEDLFSPDAPASGRISYRLTRNQGRLALERVVETEAGTRVLTSTLSAVASGRVEGPAFSATPDDVEVERLLGSRLRGVIPNGILPRLLAGLARCPDVRLDGRPVRCSGEPVVLEGRVEDQGQGFRLWVEPVPSVDESFLNGAALCGDVLHPVGETRLDGRELQVLPRGRTFLPDAVMELVGEVLPSLQRRIHVDIRTRRLPETTREKPRVRIETRREGDALEVFPTLVYGDPPTARIDAGSLVPLGGPVPLRDLDAERRLVRELAADLELAPGKRLTLRGEDAVALAEKLRGWKGDLAGDAPAGFERRAPLVPSVRVEGDGFDVRFESGEGGGRADAGRVVAAWRAGESLVPLLGGHGAGGGFAPLPADWLARHGQRLADLLAARRPDGALPAAALPDLAGLCEDLGEPAPPGFARLRALLEDFAGLPEPALPDDLTATLRPYQKRGVAWLAFLRQAGLGGLLADDMGLGKTLQALCALDGRTLVVAPTSVLPNWRDEIARFRPGLRACLYHGPRRALDPEADVVITSYAILRLDARALGEVHWGTVVLDEAQNVKNPDSQAARAAFALQADFRLTLTGTPVENRLEELWSQLHFTNPGLLAGRADFESRYARPIAAGDAATAEHLRRRIRPFVLRRRKAEVAPELPPRTDAVLHCALSDEERAVYDAVRAATVPEVLEKLGAGRGDVMAALEALLRLRQAACHPGLLPGHADWTGPSAKVELLREELETVVADGHKALVFSQWTSLLDRIEPALAGAEIPFSRLDGATRDRAGVVSAFQAEDGPPVLLVSLRAGGTGLNLTAADHVFLMDLWWNPAVEDQAADRAHRIGQDRPVLVYRMVAEATVEERILALQQRKRELADVALGGAEAAARLTREDLLGLLEA